MSGVPAGGSHHPVFARFPRWEGVTASGFEHDFLGVRTRRAWFTTSAGTDAVKRRPELPEVNEEYFEWIDLLEAVEAAEGTFTMIELGAGWGRWLARGAVAARLLGKGVRLTGVEAEPTHFRWMKRHLADNGVPRRSRDLHRAAVAETPGRVRFHVGDPAAWYGQAIDRDATPSGRRERLRGFVARQLGTTTNSRLIVDVRAITLADLLAGVDRVDLIDLDVQGVEADVLTAAAEQIHSRVRRVHVGTHSSENELRCRELFTSLGWRNVNDFPFGTTVPTEWGPVSFQDGVQTWINDSLAPSASGIS